MRLFWLLPLVVLYITAFWGRFGPPWPAFVRRYAGWVVRESLNIYTQTFALPMGKRVLATRYIWLAVSWVLALILPLAVLTLARRRWRDVGLGMPNAWGWRIVCIGVVMTALTGWIFAHERFNAGFRPKYVDLGVLLAVTVPEHFMLTGLCVALFLPGFKLRVPVEHAPIRGSWSRRTLRWLGLAQSDAIGLAWWGLDGAALLAILTGGFLFGLTHMGANPIEFTTSFPGGAALCYLTYRSGSIWPGWIIHVAQVGWAAVFMSVMLRP